MSFNPYDSPSGRMLSRIQTTRRHFLGIMGAVAFAGAAILGGVKTLGFMFPNATNEEPSQFKVDADPNSITVNSPLQITAKRVTVVRDDGGFYAVYLVCTHLGCTPNYVSDVITGTPADPSRAKLRGDRQDSERQQNGWACPCHGSRYFIDSTNFYGPAPRPMDWVEVSKAPDGKLLVDRGKIVVFRNPGDTTPPTWRFDPEQNKVVNVDASKLKNS